MSAPKTTASGRLAFIDWTRGLAAVIMLQGHTFNSFLRTDLRPNGPYMLSQFFGGLPPAMFLFLTGITFAFLMDSQERQGASTGKRIWAAVSARATCLSWHFCSGFNSTSSGIPPVPPASC